jgi:hypothetical protein
MQQNNLSVVVILVIPTLRRLKEENHKFKTNLGYIASSKSAKAVKPCRKNKTKQNKNQINYMHICMYFCVYI